MVRLIELSKRVLVMKLGLKACVAFLFISTSIGAAHSEDSFELNDLQPDVEQVSKEHQLTQKGQPRKRKWKKKPVKRACDECRRRHVSCSDTEPGKSCERCKDRNIACTWIFKTQMESGQPYFSDDEEYLGEKERPKIFHHVLDKKPNGSNKKHHNLSGKKSEQEGLLGPEKLEATVRNPAARSARSENGVKIPSYIKADAPYSSGAHYPPRIAAKRPPEPMTQNVQPASLPLGQCPHCYYYRQANQQSSNLGHQLSENSAAFFSANNLGYQNSPPYFVYGDTSLNQCPPQGAQAFYGMNVQHSGMPLNTTVAYPQTFNDGYDDYENSHEVWYENDW